MAFNVVTISFNVFDFANISIKDFADTSLNTVFNNTIFFPIYVIISVNTLFLIGVSSDTNKLSLAISLICVIKFLIVFSS